MCRSSLTDCLRLQGGDDGAVEAHDKFWAQLRKTERVAAVSLGWDAVSWDEGIAVGICGSSWSSLGPRQKEAASTLGHTAESWDRLRAAAGSGMGQRTLSRSASRSSSAAAGTPVTASSGEGPPAEVTMTQEGRVALMGAVRRIATVEGGDRFDSLR